MRISWRNCKQPQELSSGSLHCLLATNPAVGLAVLKGLRGWGQDRARSNIWQMSEQFRAWDWARMAEVGYTRVVDRVWWAGMGGSSGEGQEGGEGGGGDEKGHNNPPSPNPKSPTQAPASESAGERFHFESNDSLDGATPPPNKKQETPPPPRDQGSPILEGHPRPQVKPSPQGTPPPPKGKPDEPLVGTEAKVLNPKGVEVGTVRNVQRNKGGVVWAEYPSSTTLSGVERHLIFPTP